MANLVAGLKLNILSWKLGALNNCVFWTLAFSVLPLSQSTLSAKCCGFEKFMAYPFTLKQFYGLFSLSFFSFAFKFLVKKKKNESTVGVFGLLLCGFDHERKTLMLTNEVCFLYKFSHTFMMLRKLLYIPSLLSGFLCIFCYEKC